MAEYVRVDPWLRARLRPRPEGAEIGKWYAELPLTMPAGERVRLFEQVVGHLESRPDGACIGAKVHLSAFDALKLGTLPMLFYCAVDQRERLREELRALPPLPGLNPLWRFKTDAQTRADWAPGGWLHARREAVRREDFITAILETAALWGA